MEKAFYSIQKKYELLRSSLNKVNHAGRGELYVFAIGINSYAKEEQLDFCKQDASEFIQLFWESKKVKSKNIYKLFDNEASKLNIISHFQNFQKILKHDDQLIIYFAGHGYHTDYANFFIPYDGNRENITSCIPSSYIADSITELHSYSTILLFDLHLTGQGSTNHFNIDNRYLERQSRLLIKNDEEQESLYGKFINFFAKYNYSRSKEVFCFLKSDVRNLKNDGLILSSNSGLQNFAHIEYNLLMNLVFENRAWQALELVSNIVSNNDSDLYSRVKTLLFKLNIAESSQEYFEVKEVINNLTIELIDKINDNNFYLIKVPSNSLAISSQVENKIKILFTSANPRDGNFLRLREEAMCIEYELMKAKYRDRFEFIELKALCIDELQDALLNGAPQFLHFSGHGSCNGITLLDSYDRSKIVENKPLSEFFKLFLDDIQCIFLNSCHSVNQSQEISKYVKKIVCMSSEVPDDVAIHFAAAFYKSIGAGKDIDFSFEFAKNSIELNGIEGGEIPILMTKK